MYISKWEKQRGGLGTESPAVGGQRGFGGGDIFCPKFLLKNSFFKCLNKVY